MVQALKRFVRDTLLRLGIDLRLKTDDRRVLETIIFPYFLARPEYHRVLFVGCGWYTASYNKLFAARDYWTIEIDPAMRKYGSKNHVIDSVTNLNRHFPAGRFDVIFCNGVFGWGLDEKPEVETAFGHCFDCLREGGIFVLGWNDVPESRPFPLEELESLQRFTPFVFEPLGTARYLTTNPNRHTFDFYSRRSSA
jgi:spermidine synthase